MYLRTINTVVQKGNPPTWYEKKSPGASWGHDTGGVACGMQNQIANRNIYGVRAKESGSFRMRRRRTVCSYL